MSADNLIDGYLSDFGKELFGMDPGSRRTAIEEVRSHLIERSEDLASERGLKGPDDRIIADVLRDFGNPHEVALEYRKEMPVKVPPSIRTILIYHVLAGIIGILIFLFYTREAYFELSYTYSDMIYFRGALVIGIVYGILGFGLCISAILQLSSPGRIAYLGSITQIVAAISLVILIVGGVLQQILYSIFDIDLWEYPDNLTLGPLVIIPIIILLISIPLMDRFKSQLDLKERDPMRINRLRKRSQGLTLGASFVILIMLSALVFGSVVNREYLEDDSWKRVELLDTIQVRDGARIEVWASHGPWMDLEYRIIYDDDGTARDELFFPDLLGAVRWLADNSSTGEKVMSWWDYGYSIEGYTGLEVVIDKPTRFLDESVADTSRINEWEEDEEKIKDVANGLITLDPEITVSTMEKYDSTYLLTHIRDSYSILYALVLGAGMDSDDYFDWETMNLTDLGKNTIVSRIWRGDEIPGFEIVYSDLEVKLLKRIQ
ncbi:MAG: HAAS signaling domain-containing protein [Thermoplasmatota archaeon]